MSGVKVQTHVSPYYRFVIRSLVGIEGVSESDIVAMMIRHWIDAHREDLLGLGITYEAFRSERTSNVVAIDR